MPMSFAQRLKAKVRVDASGCWLWTASVRPDGYGQIWSPIVAGHRNLLSAHRAVYELSRGSIPSGLDLDHLCRVRLCVNPEHLEPVTRRDNVLRGDGHAAVNARKTTCPQGHQLVPRPGASGLGRRWCETCSRAYQKNYRELRRVA